LIAEPANREEEHAATPVPATRHSGRSREAPSSPADLGEFKSKF
jgi:hypothetical protein